MLDLTFVSRKEKEATYQAIFSEAVATFLTLRSSAQKSISFMR